MLAATRYNVALGWEYRVIQPESPTSRRDCAAWESDDSSSSGVSSDSAGQCSCGLAGLRVPEDVSVVGFDDIQSAAFRNPGLTTVRQPLLEMGKIAAETLLRRIAGHGAAAGTITVQPELVVRGTTRQASGQ